MMAFLRRVRVSHIIQKRKILLPTILVAVVGNKKKVFLLDVDFWLMKPEYVLYFNNLRNNY